MKEKEEEGASESVQAGRPQPQSQHSQAEQNQVQHGGVSNSSSSELLIPQFLATLAKDSAVGAQSFEFEAARVRAEAGSNDEQCRSDLPILVPLPVSSRPPPAPVSAVSSSGFGEGVFKHQVLAFEAQGNSGSNAVVEFAEDDGFGGSGGSRWPRQETLALLKIRQEMDSAFRDATLKAPLWEQVSRRLAELGFHRSAKKCKEKFENVNKYYKRTKAGRSGRHVGKTYKFFDQLEALYGNAVGDMENNGHMKHNNAAEDTNSMAAAASTSSHEMHRQMQSLEAQKGRGLSSMSLSSESSEETYDDDLPESSSRKRKRMSTKKMMIFFEKMIEKVMEKQESMQRKLLETIERREQERMTREETWRRQEMARLTRETELRSQERLLSASRDRALVEFLQKITGQAPEISQAQAQVQVQPPSQTQPRPVQIPRQENASIVQEAPEPSDPNSKRWPKQEVHALIQLRTRLEPRFNDAGPKAQLWDQISAEMAKLGYSRSAKRCKEKWENINKYFRKAKESNKERPENANTCPYFHQLDALYRKGVLKYSFSEKPLLITEHQQDHSSCRDDENNENEKKEVNNTLKQQSNPDASGTNANDPDDDNKNKNNPSVIPIPIQAKNNDSQQQDFVLQPQQQNLHTDLDLGFSSNKDASSSAASFMAMVGTDTSQMSIPGSSSQMENS